MKAKKVKSTQPVTVLTKKLSNSGFMVVLKKDLIGRFVVVYSNFGEIHARPKTLHKLVSLMETTALWIKTHAIKHLEKNYEKPC